MEVVPNTILFSSYKDRPIIKQCLERQKRKIWSLEDCEPFLKKCTHSRNMLEKKAYNYVTDQLRIYMAMCSDEPFYYVDADAVVQDLDIAVCGAMPSDYNNGTWFCADKNTDWLYVLYDWYEKHPEEQVINYVLNKRLLKGHYEPFLQDLPYEHFYAWGNSYYEKR